MACFLAFADFADQGQPRPVTEPDWRAAAANSRRKYKPARTSHTTSGLVVAFQQQRQQSSRVTRYHLGRREPLASSVHSPLPLLGVEPAALTALVAWLSAHLSPAEA